MTVPVPDAEIPPDDALMRAAGFTPDDLSANRAGQLSARQLYEFRRRRLRYSALAGGFVMLVILLASMLIFLGGQRQNFILTLIGIGVTLCNAVFLGIFSRYWLRLTGDIREAKAVINSGPLERIIKPVSNRVMIYLLRVDEAEVQVSKEVFDAAAHKMPYVLYVAPHTGAFLSAERLDSD